MPQRILFPALLVIALSSCAGVTKQDLELERHSQKEAWQAAITAAIGTAPAAIPTAAGGGPLGWAISGVTILSAAAAAYAAARKPGSKPKPEVQP